MNCNLFSCIIRNIINGNIEDFFNKIKTFLCYCLYLFYSLFRYSDVAISFLDTLLDEIRVVVETMEYIYLQFALDNIYFQ